MGEQSSDNRDLQELERFCEDSDCLNTLEEKINRINFFDILKLTRYEIRHSNMLAWLLDPNENHGLGDALLRGIIHSKTEWKDIKDYDSFSISRERYYIDLMAVSFSERIVLCIENKIDSTEHDNQLARYKETVRTLYPEFRSFFIYLTPEGKTSSESENWASMSYGEIYRMIDEAKNRTTLSCEADQIISNYLETVRRDIVGDNKDIQDLCAEIYTKHRKALDLIYKYKPSFFMNGGYAENPPEKEDCDIYRIQPGDTLTLIAKKFGTGIKSIMSVNDTIQDENCITVGYYIYIPKTTNNI